MQFFGNEAVQLVIAATILCSGAWAMAAMVAYSRRREKRLAGLAAGPPESVRLVSLEGVREIRIVLVRDTEQEERS